MANTITPEALLSYMIPGRAYRAEQLSIQFYVGAAGIRVVLQDLARAGTLVERKVNRRYTWTKPHDEQSRQLPPMKPLTFSREMQNAIGRCRELYPVPSRHV